VVIVEDGAMNLLPKKLSLFVLAVSLLVPVAGFAQQSSPQVPQPANGDTNWAGVGYGVGSAFSSVVYFPFKMAYAIGGGIVGATAYAVTAGNSQVANTIWRSSMGGDYVVTPEVLQGKDQLHFSGPTTTAADGSASAAPVAPTSSTVGTQPMNSGSAASHASAPADHSVE
jgi:hypothetical protein